MSVPSWQRKNSKVVFLNQLSELFNICTTMIFNMPNKYARLFGDKILDSCIEAMEEADVANSIYMSECSLENDYLERRDHFEKSRGIVKSLSNICNLVLLKWKNVDGVERTKILKYQEEIGKTCSTIIDTLTGVIKSDLKQYKKIRKNVIKKEENQAQRLYLNALRQSPFVIKPIEFFDVEKKHEVVCPIIFNDEEEKEIAN